MTLGRWNLFRLVESDSKHGLVENLGMPAMTMVFRVKDAAMLDQVKAGIRFLAEKVDGVLSVARSAGKNFRENCATSTDRSRAA